VKEPAWLSIHAVLAMHELLVAEHGGSPVLRDRALLESALAAPKNHFAYGERDLVVLASAYAYSVTRNHPFVDGNKRTAFIAAYTFLEINGMYLSAGEEEVVAAVVGLSARTMSLNEFTDWLRRSCKKTSSRSTGRRSGRIKDRQ
jgi:death-on-curing protein